MNLTNDTYMVVFHITAADGTEKTERYYRDARSAQDKKPWVKVSTRGNQFRATAEQVLNHLLPALVGFHPRLRVEVEYYPDGAASKQKQS